jgi:sulfide:quinone oxidoreductase
MSEGASNRLVVAGAGVAGLEALAALAAIAPGRFDVTVVSPAREFAIQAESVKEPFAQPAARRFSVPDACADLGAEFVEDAIAAVEPATRHAVTEDGARIPYDYLLVAVGARRLPVYAGRAIVFRGQQDADRVNGLIRDVEGGYAKRLEFVVPSGVTWPLPLYELALMTAHRAREMSLDDVAVGFVTPEELPLAVFGREASAAVRRALDDAGIELRTATYVERVGPDGILLSPSGELMPPARVVTVPRLEGPRIGGLPADEDGFVYVDEHCRVRALRGVWAAGDGTIFPVKQGGLAAQQADAAALSIASSAGIEVEAPPFDPVLRAKLLTGSRTQYLREALGPTGGEETSEASEQALWWPPAKVAAPYLTGYLEGVAERKRTGRTAGVEPGPGPRGGAEVLGG